MRAGVVYALAALPLAVMSCAPAGTDPPDDDLDDDGYLNEDDCEPENASVHPGAVEVCDNALDDDCSGGAPECRRTGVLSMDDADAYVTGDSPGVQLGQVVRAVGDLNADGADEFSFTAHTAGNEPGGHFIVAGGSALPATQGDSWALITEGSTELLDLVGVGDIDGDGTDDLGAPRNDDDAHPYQPVVFTSLAPGEQDAAVAEPVTGDPAPDGIMHVVGGSDLSGDGGVDLALLGLEANYICEGPVASSNMWDSACGVTIRGGDQGRASDIVSSADLDGDGIGEVVLSYPGWCADTDATSTCSRGLLRVVMGPVDGNVSWEQSDGLLVGDNASAGLGYPLDLGDIDGDGLDEIAATADGDVEDGSVYFIGVEDLATGELANVATVFHESEAPSLSVQWTPADFDGDGVNDLAYRAKATDPVVAESDWYSAVFVAYGPIGLNLSPALEVHSSSTVQSGGAVGVGDLNGDSHGELLITHVNYGNPYVTEGEFYAYGRIAMFFGEGL